MVDEINWPDYVFEPSYKLQSLKEVENFIEQNGHLPNMPSREEVLKNGVDIGQTVNILTEKVEELFLHSIEQEKLIEGQKIQIEKLKKINEEQSKFIETQKELIDKLFLQIEK
jgi:hypothetical protein